MHILDKIDSSSQKYPQKSSALSMTRPPWKSSQEYLWQDNPKLCRVRALQRIPQAIHSRVNTCFFDYTLAQEVWNSFFQHILFLHHHLLLLSQLRFRNLLPTRNPSHMHCQWRSQDLFLPGSKNMYTKLFIYVCVYIHIIYISFYNLFIKYL